MKAISICMSCWISWAFVFTNEIKSCTPGETKVDIISTFVTSLKSKDANVRRDAAKKLGKLGPNAKPGVGALITCLADEDLTVAYAAAGALAEIGSGCLGNLQKALTSPDVQTRRFAVIALSYLGSNAKAAVPNLIKLLRSDKNVRVRIEAIVALSDIGDQSAIPVLMEIAKKDINSQECIHCIRVLPKFGSEAKGAMTFLAQILKMKGKPQGENEGLEIIKSEAAASLVSFEKPAVPFLIDVLKDVNNDYSSRALAAYSICRLGMGLGSDAITDAVPTLVEIIRKKETRMYYHVLEALGHAGPNAKQAVPLIFMSTKESSTSVRIMAAWAMSNIDNNNDFSVPILIEALKSNNQIHRARAAVVLFEMGQAAANAVSALRKTLKDPDGGVRMEAAYALGNIGELAKDAIPDLVIATKDNERDVRIAAEKALRSIRRKTKSK